MQVHKIELTSSKRERVISKGRAAVSVIVPTYCEEKNIEWTLRSIKNQDFAGGCIEIIVVDSNSPDNTRRVASNYADKVVNLRCRGVGRARNLGAREANGEILLFLDADTVLDRRFVTKMYESFSNKNVVCVTGTVAGLENLGPINNFFAFSHYGVMNEVASLSARLGFPFFPTVCCACRRSVFIETGGFDEDIAIAEDLIFSRKMGKVGECLVNREAKAYTSLRRITKCGRLKTYFIYFRNYFKVFVLNKRPWIQDFPNMREI